MYIYVYAETRADVLAGPRCTETQLHIFNAYVKRMFTAPRRRLDIVIAKAMVKKMSRLKGKAPSRKAMNHRFQFREFVFHVWLFFCVDSGDPRGRLFAFVSCMWTSARYEIMANVVS